MESVCVISCWKNIRGWILANNSTASILFLYRSMLSVSLFKRTFSNVGIYLFTNVQRIRCFMKMFYKMYKRFLKFSYYLSAIDGQRSINLSTHSLNSTSKFGCMKLWPNSNSRNNSVNLSTFKQTKRC